MAMGYGYGLQQPANLLLAILPYFLCSISVRLERSPSCRRVSVHLNFEAQVESVGEELSRSET